MRPERLKLAGLLADILADIIGALAASAAFVGFVF
jgi:hypothetical protein